MSGVKDILKKGWHPEKEGTTLKGQMKSLVGRGDTDTRRNHTVRPLTSLQDPSSFGPPPVRRQTAGTPSPPISRPMSTSSPSPTSPYHPPTSTQRIATEETPASPKQYRINTTGLSTTNLPPPPARRDGTASSPANPPVLPRLPPRLPPRNASTTHPSLPARSECPGNSFTLNQGAVNRLGAAGISVSGFGIGKPTSTSEPVQAPVFTGLQSQFSRLGTSTSPSPPPAAPSQGTTLEQKRAAIKTAAAFRQDPSSVSISDARAAASTANNFRQRHGDQVASGMQTASNLYGKYGARVGQGNGGGEGVVEQVKKKPPPPPPKKPQSFRVDRTPPTIPLSTKPQF